MEETSVEIEFIDTENLVDRILMEFSPWRKRCRLDTDTGVYRLRIYYQKSDESDLVIRLLGYGTHIRLVDRTHPIEQEIRKRLEKQLKVGKRLIKDL